MIAVIDYHAGNVKSVEKALLALGEEAVLTRDPQVILDAASDVISHNNSVHPKRLWTDKKGGELIKYYRATDDREESNWIVSQIKKLINEGRNPGDIALLYRMNSLTRTTEQALQRERIPYEITGGTKFFDRREVKDI